MKHIIDCQHCGKEFEGKRSTATYCSPSCRQMAYVKRSDAEYRRRMLDEKSFIQPATVNKVPSQSKLASTNHSNTTVLPSTNMGYTGSYRQLPVNNQSVTDNIPKESEQQSVVNVNTHLKQWIQELLSYESKKEINRSQIRFLLFDINRFIRNERNVIPKEYPHTAFIEKSLIPKLERMLAHAQANRLFSFRLTIPEDFKKEMAEILK